MENYLTPKQAKFVSEFLDTGNATEAARRAYEPRNRATARSMGSENLTKPNIRAYLDEKAQDAASTVYKLSQRAKSEAVRLNASKDILDRTGYGGIKKTAVVAEFKKSDPMAIAIAQEYEAKLKELFSENGGEGF